MKSECDVVVVGGGNAGLCAALAARETGASVLLIERAPFDERGGNSMFTAGGMRVAYRGVEDIRRLSPDLSDEVVAKTDFGTYTEQEFFDDMARVTDHRTDPDLTDVIVSKSFETLEWLRDRGVRFLPIYGRQAYEIDGRFTFWGGMTIEAVGGGPGLVDSLTSAAEKAGVTIWYGTRALNLITEETTVVGLRARQDGRTQEIRAKSVVLASGGFEANAEWRARYLGPGYDLAKVRGTRYNTGDGIRMALDAGAMAWGNWSGAHAVGWELNAPPFGDLAVGDAFQKHSYPFGIMVNANGERFVDEGADFRNLTYAKYGHAIMAQPNHFAWQIFDQRVAHLLRDEYRIKQVTKVTAPTLEALAGKLDGVDPDQFLATIKAYNAAVDVNVPFNPNIKDGRSARLVLPKTNWANVIDEPPFEGYAITCGVTFTFGGLRISVQAEVLDTEERVMPGLYACGELVGGIFYGNYPGGAGLTNGSVFGRTAGTQAGHAAIAQR